MNDFRQDYALLVYLAGRVGSPDGAGKKALQKIVHLVTNLAGIESRYDFDLYTYGPFSRDLAEDMDLLATSHVLDVTYDVVGRCYHIKKGAEADKITTQYTEFLKGVEEKSGALLNYFSGKPARTLEMYSTLFFIIDRKLVDDVDNYHDVAEKFRQIKPKYSAEEAYRAIEYLRKIAPQW